MRHARTIAVALVSTLAAAAFAQGARALTGKAALGGWRTDAPGVRRQLAAADMATPKTDAALEEATTQNKAEVIPMPSGAKPKAPAGFKVDLLATGFNKPRTIRVAPNGDAFVAESDGGRILVFRAQPGGGVASTPEVFAAGLQKPYGIAFHPPASPSHVYVGEHHQVVRFSYPKAGAPDVIVPGIPTERHWTRDVVSSKDGSRLFVAIGSGSNLAGGMPAMASEALKAHEAAHGRGAAWGKEMDRAVVRSFAPDGKNLKTYATGLRNCSGLAVHPTTGELWCAVNERDGLGDDVPFEYVTSVREGGFYGWPWFYIGNREDPRRKGERRDLAGAVEVGDVLLEPHTAPLGMTFHDGHAYVAMHGSWNRSERAGYKVVRLPMKDGKAVGTYEDFLTGFVVDAKSVWGRPVGVAALKDGSLLVSDDGSGSIWRVSAAR